MLAMLALPAMAYDADALMERLDEVKLHRALRLATVAPELTDKEYRAAADGKIATGVMKVEGHSAKLGYGVGVLDVGIDDLWAGINDETRHGDILPLSHTEIVHGSECQSGRRVLMVLPLPVVSDRWWINENTYNPAITQASGGTLRELSWSSLDDPASHAMSTGAKAAVDGLVPVEYNRGAWFLIALDDSHTLAEYHSWVDPGGSIPAYGASMFATSGIEDTFNAMADYAKKGDLPCK